MIAGGYIYTLFCDGPKCSYGDHGRPAFLELMGKNVAQCRKRLSETGWYLITKDDKAFCPKCAKAYKTTTAKPFNPKANPKLAQTLVRKVKVSTEGRL